MTEEYLLEIGALNVYLRGRVGTVALIEPWVANGQASTSVLAYGEIVEFLQGLPDYSLREAELRDVLHDVHPYQVTYPVLRRYAALRRTIRPPSGPGIISDVDTLIAATALERGCTVVTMDSDFTRVPVLVVRPVERGALR